MLSLHPTSIYHETRREDLFLEIRYIKLTNPLIC